MVIYDTLYSLLEQYIYGGYINPGDFSDLVCTLVSTIGCLFVVALPFVVVWRAIKLFI